MRFLDWLLGRPRATIDPRGVSKSVSSTAVFNSPPSPLRDSTGSHWVQVLRRSPDLLQVPGYLGAPEWVWCCTVCCTLSLPSSEQTSSDPAPHLATPHHREQMTAWDSDENHACVRLRAPVWEEASELAEAA